MAITVNSAVDSGKVPKQPLMAGEIDVDLDATSILNGYDLSDSLPDGVTVIQSTWVPNYDGSALRWFRVVDVSGVPRLQAYTSVSGAPGALVGAGVDLSGHTGLVVGWIGK